MLFAVFAHGCPLGGQGRIWVSSSITLCLTALRQGLSLNHLTDLSRMGTHIQFLAIVSDPQCGDYSHVQTWLAFHTLAIQTRLLHAYTRALTH